MQDAPTVDGGVQKVKNIKTGVALHEAEENMLSGGALVVVEEKGGTKINVVK